MIDGVYGLKFMIMCIVILSLKKSEDYIACYSKLKTLVIVSIHQRRIKDESGKLDGGLAED